MPIPFVYFFTDFSVNGPYLGQMESVLLEQDPNIRVINLQCDAPFANPKASAYLLSALSAYLPENAIVVAVVDAGVGSSRKALCLNIGSRWFIGPDNGLLAVLADNAEGCTLLEPESFDQGFISASFHGRDVFAPLAADIALGKLPAGRAVVLDDMVGASWSTTLDEIIYIDGYGNAMTGMLARSISNFKGIRCRQQYIPQGRTFSSVAQGTAFCYENSIGLIEIAVNCGSAEKLLGLQVGQLVKIVK